MGVTLNYILKKVSGLYVNCLRRNRGQPDVLFYLDEEVKRDNLGMMYPVPNRIHINVEEIIETRANPIATICGCLAHEYIHHAILKHEGLDTTIKFDKIAYSNTKIHFNQHLYVSQLKPKMKDDTTELTDLSNVLIQLNRDIRALKSRVDALEEKDRETTIKRGYRFH